MPKMHISADGRMISDPGGGTAGFISWRRLKELLRAAKEIKENERLRSYTVTEDGITIYVEYE